MRDAAVLSTTPTPFTFPCSTQPARSKSFCPLSSSFRPIAKLVFALGTLGLVGSPALGHPLLVDSFDDGFFGFSHDQSSYLSQQQFGSMLGGDRGVTLSTYRRTTVVSASVQENSSLLAFDTGTGEPGLLYQGLLALTYGGGSPSSFPAHALGLDLSNFEFFEFDIASTRGSGAIAVVLNSGRFGTGTKTVPLESAGTLRYPFSEVNAQTFAAVEQIQIYVVGLTTDFALSLHEVRIVPEPASLLLLAGVFLLSSARPLAAPEALRRSCLSPSKADSL